MIDLQQLVQMGKINPYHVRIFTLFEMTDIGKEYLSDKFYELFMEEPERIDKELSCWYDGRKSVFRDIQRIIDHVYEKIEEVKND